MSSKKDILDAFVGSITKPTAPAPGTATVTPSSTPGAAAVEASQPTHQEPANTDQVQGCTVRQTFVMNSVHLDKLRYIALKEHTKQKDVLGQALEAYIKQWERKHGTIII